MSVETLTQRLINQLVNGPPPEKDVLYWSDRDPGFGVKRGAGSRHTSFIYQWRDKTTSRSHRQTIGPASQLKLDVALRHAADRAAEIAAGRNPIEARRKKLTVAELVERYLKSDAWKRKAPGTKAGDARRIQLYLLPAWGKRIVADVKLADFKKLMAELTDSAKAQALAARGGAVKRCARGGEGAARRVLRAILPIFRWARREDVATVDPSIDAMEIPADNERTRNVLSAREYRQIWGPIAELRRAPSTATAAAAVAILALTGLRRSEVLRLRWRDVSLERSLLSVTRRVRGKERRHEVALCTDAQHLLRQLPERAGPAFVFASTSGRPVSIGRLWKRISAAAHLRPEVFLDGLHVGLPTHLIGEGGWTNSDVNLFLGRAQHRTDRQRRVLVHLDKLFELAERAALLVKPPGSAPLF